MCLKHKTLEDEGKYKYVCKKCGAHSDKKKKLCSPKEVRD